MNAFQVGMELAGGLAIFLYGMTVTGAGLQQAAASGLKQVVQRLVRGRLSALGLGALLAAALQSSSAASVLIVGLTSAGLITMQQGMAVALGAGVGTTITPQLVTLKITDYALALVVLGVAAKLTLGRRAPAWGEAALGFGLIFLGIQVMMGAMEPVRESPATLAALSRAAEHMWLLVLSAALFTAVVQSSSAVVALAVTMAEQGLLGLAAGLGVVLGANIGTTVTAILSSLVGSRAARQAAVGMTLFRVLAAAAVLLLFTPALELLQALPGSTGRLLAHGHTLFNIGVALVFLPLLPAVSWTVLRLWPRRPAPADGGRVELTPELLAVPELALYRLQEVVQEMAATVSQKLVSPLPALLAGAAAPGDAASQSALIESELERAGQGVQTAYRDLVAALARAGAAGLTARQSQAELQLLLAAAELHGAAAHARAIGRALHRARQRGVQFSAAGRAELQRLAAAAAKGFQSAVGAWTAGDPAEAAALDADHAAWAEQAAASRREHYRRVRQGITESAQTSDLHHQILAALTGLSLHGLALARLDGNGPTPAAVGAAD